MPIAKAVISSSFSKFFSAIKNFFCFQKGPAIAVFNSSIRSWRVPILSRIVSTWCRFLSARSWTLNGAWIVRKIASYSAPSSGLLVSIPMTGPRMESPSRLESIGCSLQYCLWSSVFPEFGSALSDRRSSAASQQEGTYLSP